MQELDALRRPQRFLQFLCACEADARGRLGHEDSAYPQAAYLREALTLVQTVSAAPLLAQGLRGLPLAKALQQQRIAVLRSALPRPH